MHTEYKANPMNHLFIFLFSVFSITSAFAGITPKPWIIQNIETVDIKVIVTNINSQKGIIHIGVFNNSKSFLNKGEEFMTLEKNLLTKPWFSI